MFEFNIFALNLPSLVDVSLLPKKFISANIPESGMLKVILLNFSLSLILNFFLKINPFISCFLYPKFE